MTKKGWRVSLILLLVGLMAYVLFPEGAYTGTIMGICWTLAAIMAFISIR